MSWALILVLLGLLAFLLFGYSTASVSESGSQMCVASVTDSKGLCGPELINGQYQVPDSGVVVYAAVNKGPVAPEYQHGYGVEVDADGTVTVQQTAASDTHAGTPAASVTRVRTFTVGQDAVQSLLGELDGCGLFYLPQTDEIHASVGGPEDEIQVSLNDANWNVSAAGLESDEQREELKSCQGVIAEFAGVDPSE